MSKKVLIINGPNLEMLGKRDKSKYGDFSLDGLMKLVSEEASKLNCEVEFFQSNIEGEIVNFIQEAGNKASGVIINPAAYTHTSVAIHDALKSLIIPSIEIHLSQPAKRESFRHKSLIAEVVNGTISGFGPNSYLLAMKAIDDLLKTNTES